MDPNATPGPSRGGVHLFTCGKLRSSGFRGGASLANIPIGAAITAVRQPDIVVPLFDPSYTIDVLGINIRRFQRSSLFPLINPEGSRWEHNGAFAFLDTYTPGPFGYGRTTFNLANDALSNDNNDGGLLLLGNILFAATTGVGAFAGGTDYGGFATAQLFPGKNPANFDINISPKMGLIPWPESNMEFVGAFMLSSSTLTNHVEFGLMFQSVNSTGKVYVQSFNPTVPGGLLSRNIVNRGELYNFVGQSGSLSFLTAIPSLNSETANSNQYGINGLITWLAWNGGPLQGTPLFVGPTVMDQLNATEPYPTFPIKLDNAALQSGLLGNPYDVQSTNFGFLIYNNSAGISGYRNLILLSMDGTKYSMLTFQVFGKTTAGWISSLALNVPSVTIDPAGIVYVLNSSSPESATQIANSFSLDIPWAPVAVPMNAVPVLTIPELCGCIPLAGYAKG